MTDPTLARLEVAGVAVAEYASGLALDPTSAPRPHFHPVRTLRGTVVTDARPDDHPWHLGLGVAIQDVGGWNLWGGPTFVGGQGYLALDDHGRVEHDGFLARDGAGWVDRLTWRTRDGAPLLTEERSVGARPLGEGYQLGLRTTLTNATGAPLRLGSPATNGRTGAGYGGLFWRLPSGDRPRVATSQGEGEAACHGAVTPRLLWQDPVLRFTLVLSTTDSDPWFVRLHDYPGVGLQLAGSRPVVLPVGGSLTRELQALVLDGVDDPDPAPA
jgi:hypothetical protein